MPNLAPPAGALFDWPRLSAELNADLRRMVDSGAAAMDQPTALADITPELILDAAPLFASPLDFTTAGPMFSAITDEFGTFLETDAAVFQQEKARIFFRTWQYAGHLSQVPAPGDYVTLDICGQGLFVIRGRDGELRAFHNVCQHRAHPLLVGEGRAEVIICPYMAGPTGPTAACAGHPTPKRFRASRSSRSA